MKVPKSLRKLTIQDKKRFVDLFDQGSRDDAYFNYLALNKGEVDYLKDQIDSIKTEVKTWGEERTKRQDIARAEAIKMNEKAREEGVVVEDSEENNFKKLLNWKVPKGKEKEFVLDCGKMSIVFMLKKWCSNKKSLLREIERLENTIKLT